MLKLTNIKILPDFKIEVSFQNGEKKICDLNLFLDKGAFKELRDLSLFKQIHNTGFSLEWPNEVDLSSETLYAIGK
jgi:hypothetical protein